MEEEDTPHGQPGHDDVPAETATHADREVGELERPSSVGCVCSVEGAAVRKRPDSTTATAAAGTASRRSTSRLATAIAARCATSALAAIGV